MSEKQVVKVIKLCEEAHLPEYASAGAAAADVRTVSRDRVVINPGCAHVFGTGLKFEVPAGYQLKVYSRSGHGFKHGIRLSNCTGILDSDYRGELMVRLHNDSDTAFIVEPGERICQVQVMEAVQHSFVEASELSETARGDSGFGSTGRVDINSPG